MNAFEWVEAGTIETTLEAIRESEGARLKAGGIDLMGLMKEGVLTPSRLVNLKAAKGLDGVEADATSGLRLGALVTLAEIAKAGELQGEFAALSQAAGHAATPQIRNVATIAGNLLQRPRCWYFQSVDFQCLKKGGTECFAQNGDNRYHAVFGNEICAIVHPSATAVALMALAARVEIASAGGARKTMPIDELFVAPSEDVRVEHRLPPDRIIVSIRLDHREGRTSCYLKQGEKESFDWPIADVAVALELASDRRCTAARIVLGAAAPIPWRVPAAEKALQGRVIDAASASAAAAAAIEGATPLAMNRYKLGIFEALVRRAILSAANG